MIIGKKPSRHQTVSSCCPPGKIIRLTAIPPLPVENKTAWEAVFGICRGGKGPPGRASGRERVTRRGEGKRTNQPVAPHPSWNLPFLNDKWYYSIVALVCSACFGIKVVLLGIRHAGKLHDFFNLTDRRCVSSGNCQVRILSQ